MSFKIKDIIKKWEIHNGVTMKKLFITIITTQFLISGCSYFTFQKENGLTTKVCEDFYDELEDVIDDDDANDRQFSRMKDFPYLRSNRFLASFYDEVENTANFKNWVDLLQQNAFQANKIEIANLSESKRNELLKFMPKSMEKETDVNLLVEKCSATLRTSDLALDANRQLLIDQSRVASSYSTLRRIAGLYYPVKYAVDWSIKREYAKVAERYKTELSKIKTKGKVTRYYPKQQEVQLSKLNVARIIRRSAFNHLRVPLPEGKELDDLFYTYAPIWEVDVVKNNDLIGKPFWEKGKKYPSIDTKTPVSYQFISHVRYEDKIFLQLNYVIWFSGRSSKSALDGQSGRMAGLTWRVTLNDVGEPILYDSTHNCGCYHHFYPTNKLAKRAGDFDKGELMIAPQKQIPEFKLGQRLVLPLAHNDHFLLRVYNENDYKNEKKEYSLAPYDELRSIALDKRHKSLFDEDAIVLGSKRWQGWYLASLGIDDAGSLKQVGSQATAYTGKRHFDDAYLLERYFVLKK